MPVYTKVKKSIGTSGLADVRVLKSSLRVIFADGDQYEVSNEGWEYPAGKYQVTLSQLNDKVLWVQPPPNVTLLVKFKEFGNRQNEVPEPKLSQGGQRKGKNGGTYYQQPELRFTAQLETVTGEYAGMTVPYQLPYAFENYPGTSFTMITAKASRLVKIEEFLRIAGLDLVNEDIPFSDNVLPWLEQRLQKANKIFQVQLNDKGFIAQVVEIPDYLIPSDLLKPAKKSASKSKAKAPAKAKTRKSRK